MNQFVTRRQALKTSFAVTSGFWVGTSVQRVRAADANSQLNVALIGVGGQGRSNLNGVRSQHIVALCDVDDQRAGDAYQRFPKARKFFDYRSMFDAMEDQIDAVVVSTPDHSHFHPSYLALQMGKHLYCEKPMAHSVWETRVLTDLAAKKGVATQLGVQRHTIPNMHRVVELVQAGAIGDVTECHCWIDSDRGMPEIPTAFPEVPPHLKWDLWLGPAQERPYSDAYCPYNWRFWWDFGTGETGNWGCHILDIPFWALDLKYPSRVEASGPEVDTQRTPKSLATRFVFEADRGRPAMTLHWYQAKSGPEVLSRYGMKAKGNNTLFIGTEGMLLCGFGQRKLYPEDKFADFSAPEPTIPNSPGFHQEWFDSCAGGDKATCDFSYSGPLAETVLLGNAAYRAQGAFDWNAAQLKATGNALADDFLVPHFRKGWEVDV